MSDCPGDKTLLKEKVVGKFEESNAKSHLDNPGQLDEGEPEVLNAEPNVI